MATTTTKKEVKRPMLPKRFVLLLLLGGVYLTFCLVTAYLHAQKTHHQQQQQHQGLSRQNFHDVLKDSKRKRKNSLPLLISASSNSSLSFDSQQQRLTPDKSAILQNWNTRPSANATDDDKLFISYQLHSNRPYNITYGYFTKCYVGVKTNKWGRKPIRRVALAPDLAKVLGVTTTLQTNLKILSLGDSVGIQYHQLLEEAAGAQWQNRQLYQFAWGEHESTSVAAPVDGGGVLAAFRMTGMLLEAHRGQAPPNAQGGGWLPEHVQQLLNHTYQHDDDGNHHHPKVVVERFDAMIFRIPHGWLTLEDITEATLAESLVMAHKLFGVQTAIVLTLPLNNNVKTMEELEQLHQTNAMIRRVVDSWSEERGPQHVLLMDFGTWADQLIEWNARVSGMDTTTQSNANNYMLTRLG
jgi:hypothetical protein